MNNHKWAEFRISDIFVIMPGKRLTKADMKEGERPFIGATDSNNGITAWISNTNESLDSHCLGVNYNGSVGETFYHPYECVFSDDVKRLHLKESSASNYYVMLFLKTAIMQQKVKYAYGYKFNESRMQKQVILLPITTTGQPDWNFMESFMRQKEQQILKPTIDKLCKQLIFNQIGGGQRSLLNYNWKEFSIGDLFEAKRPSSRREDDYPDGKAMFVASGGINNGVTKFCQPKEGEHLDCLTVSPVDGSCHYQPVDFLGRGGAGSSIIILYAKTFSLDRFNGLFIAKAISQTAASKYSYGHMASLDRIKRDKILLPIDAKGQPDFAFMSSFMREVEKNILGTTIKYFADKQAVTTPPE